MNRRPNEQWLSLLALLMLFLMYAALMWAAGRTA